MKENNYRPKRSIVFCSWGSEEHGLIGSEEFVEEFHSIIRERGIAYINADVAFDGNGYFSPLASPIFDEFLYHVAQIVPDHIDETKTVYERWLENKKDENTQLPSIGRGGVGSDYGPFAHMAGLSFIDVGVKPSNRSVRSYSTYH